MLSAVFTNVVSYRHISCLLHYTSLFLHPSFSLLSSRSCSLPHITPLKSFDHFFFPWLFTSILLVSSIFLSISFSLPYISHSIYLSHFYIRFYLHLYLLFYILHLLNSLTLLYYIIYIIFPVGRKTKRPFPRSVGQPPTGSSGKPMMTHYIMFNVLLYFTSVMSYIVLSTSRHIVKLTSCC